MADAIEAVHPDGVDSLTKTSDKENGELVRKNIGKVRETAAKGEERKAALTGALAISIGLMVCLAFWVFLFSPSERHSK